MVTTRSGQSTALDPHPSADIHPRNPPSLPSSENPDVEPASSSRADGMINSEEDDDSGALLVPCKCSGTARFVHSACLTSWRLADRKNGFCRCGMCGEEYRMRKTVWTSLAGGKATVPLLALFLALIVAATAGLATVPLMRFSDRRFMKVETTRPFHLRSAVIEYFFLTDYVDIGDVLRESASFYGLFTGDCRFSSPLEPRLVTEEVSYGKDFSMTETHGKSETRTWCSEVWGYEEDKERREGVLGAVSRAVGHLWRGWTLASLSPALIGQPAIRFLAIRSCLSPIFPSLTHYLSSPKIEGAPLYIQTIFASNINTTVQYARPKYKAARVAGRFFSVWQCGLLLVAALTSLWAATVLVKVARWILRNRFARVENVVLDVRELDDRAKRE
ncbi:hypothetical protein JCM8547_006606 [Rhodosporidiobolus lusitaniae]